ncbi:NADH:ubiquinone oxidoreductase complex I intermediate-associated protein 30 [Acaromyces ingoldii]|uniref:NADH:ubiquinone oxidoreductase complex I intermediate-associated protein 30 n=1 Tax=Acaromyces ingoldii TaxID=215250 RepID=A0A316YKU2_9BASI|nr:NADH:ubiquinone oxidoreductase complex I intermediate-associated protein 30 [Acaromyces ingoldii]PWN89841.1 NADH:ubiquinone oxidoreductase complex I intermediate-associated protein 30 [Acaromyces ingoldii]
MSLAKSIGSALSRTLDSARQSLASSMRMEVSPPTASATDSRLLLYPLRSSQDLSQVARGCDADIGGLSSCRLDLDESGSTSAARFWGTLSSELPRGAKIERSGYAGFRNRSRPTLFSSMTWDTTMHPFLSLRVRNRLAATAPPSSSSAATAVGAGSGGLRSVLAASNQDRTDSYSRAVHALGLDRKPSPPGPKFFVNVQTDGPVTSDLFQHRLWLDEAKGDEWQDVVIPLDDFVLTNTGQVAPVQISMMREKIRTVGISVVLENPPLGNLASRPAQGEGQKKDQVPGALKQAQKEGEWVLDGDLEASLETLRGSKRGASYNFDLGIERIEAISEEAL